jgi:hypothetical protein
MGGVQGLRRRSIGNLKIDAQGYSDCGSINRHCSATRVRAAILRGGARDSRRDRRCSRILLISAGSVKSDGGPTDLHGACRQKTLRSRSRYRTRAASAVPRSAARSGRGPTPELGRARVQFGNRHRRKLGVASGFPLHRDRRCGCPSPASGRSDLRVGHHPSG